MAATKWMLAALCFAVLGLGVSCTLGGDTGELFTENSAAAPVVDNAPVPGYGSGIVPWEDAAAKNSLLVAVRVAPQPELRAGDGKLTAAVSAVPYVKPPVKPADARGVSAAAAAEEYYYSENVAPSVISADVEGGCVTFDASKSTALACFEVTARPAPPETLWTVGLAWYSLPEQMASYFVGIADPTAPAGSGVWHWYTGPDDGVLSFDPGSWAEGAPGGDNLMLCIALEPGARGQVADFWKLRGSVAEVRGTGLLPNDPVSAPPAPKLSAKAASSLPSSVDLASFLPPISDQGQMGSCTAFGCADAGFNVLLSQLYGGLGWNPAQNTTRVSPMYNYVRSGIAPIGNWNPPCGSSVGRYMSQSFEELRQLGCASQATVPYYATEDCETTFPELAGTEAPLLRIDNWYSVSGTGSQVVETIKNYLGNQQTPVVIAMYGLESGFLYYSGGVYHYGGTAGYAGGHCMCITGYDDSLQAFNVRNSWGAWWGNDGYWWCGYDAVEDLVNAGGRFYAYTMSASYNSDAAAYFFGAGPEYDEAEPNDNLPQAGALPDFDFANFTGGLNGGDVQDWYSFSYSAGYSTEFTLNFSEAQGQLKLELYKTDGTLLAQSSGSAGTQSLSGLWSDSGSARLKVLRVSGAGDYTLAGTKTHPPQPPTGISATDGLAASSITVEWTGVSGAISYLIQRATGETGPFVQVGTTFATRFVDNQAEAWTVYWYRVISVNAEGSSLPSVADSGYRGAVAPAGLSASDGSFSSRVELSWQAQAGAAAFRIRRATRSEGPYSVIAEVDSAQYSDTAVQPGAVYYYTVAALSGTLEGAESAPEAGHAQAVQSGQLAPQQSSQDALPAQDAADGERVDVGRDNGGRISVR